MGFTKSLKEGPEFSVSLKDVRALGCFGGAGADVWGVSEVVAKVRRCWDEGVRERGRDCRRRHRDRGIAAAIVEYVYAKRKKERRSEGERCDYGAALTLNSPTASISASRRRTLGDASGACLACLHRLCRRNPHLRHPCHSRWHWLWHFEGIFNVANSARPSHSPPGAPSPPLRPDSSNTNCSAAPGHCCITTRQRPRWWTKCGILFRH